MWFSFQIIWGWFRLIAEPYDFCSILQDSCLDCQICVVSLTLAASSWRWPNSTPCIIVMYSSMPMGMCVCFFFFASPALAALKRKQNNSNRFEGSPILRQAPCFEGSMLTCHGLRHALIEFSRALRSLEEHVRIVRAFSWLGVYGKPVMEG